MAKKGKKSTGSRRRRRVSGISTGGFTPILGGIAGAVAVAFINSSIQKSGTKVNPKILAGLELLAAALFVPKFIKGPMGTGVAIGIGTSSGLSLVQSIAPGLVSGVSDFYRMPTINGMAPTGMKRVAGSARQVLAGVDIATKSADVRNVRPSNHNFATKSSQMNVLSGVEDFVCDEQQYGVQ